MDFKRLDFNPVVLGPTEFIWDKYPRLKKRDAFFRIPEEMDDFNLHDLNDLLKFMVIFVDPDSPFWDERDFDYRASQCLKTLHLAPSARFYQEVSEKTGYWNFMLYEYFRFINTPLFEMWFSVKENFHIMNMKLRDATIKETDRLKLIQEIDVVLGKLTNLEYKLFPDEKTAKAVADIATEKSLGGYAEMFAQTL